MAKFIARTTAPARTTATASASATAGKQNGHWNNVLPTWTIVQEVQHRNEAKIALGKIN